MHVKPYYKLVPTVFTHSCTKCHKNFSSESAYQTHLKMKHNDRNEPSYDDHSDQSYEVPEHEQSPSLQYHFGNTSPKEYTRKSGKKISDQKKKNLENRQNELEDSIYTFLGEIGERNIEPTSNRIEASLYNARMVGQTNYSINKIIRTPHEEPIKCSEALSETKIAKRKHAEFLLVLRSEVEYLEKRLLAEKDLWELRDPLANESYTEDEFSLMDMRKLVRNYPRRGLKLQYAHFAMYLLWVGRICKETAVWEFFLILGEYLAEYYAVEEHRQKTEENYKAWNLFFNEYESRRMENHLLQGLQIFEEKSSKKFLDYYKQWVDLFQTLNL